MFFLSLVLVIESLHICHRLRYTLAKVLRNHLKAASFFAPNRFVIHLSPTHSQLLRPQDPDNGRRRRQSQDNHAEQYPNAYTTCPIIQIQLLPSIRSLSPVC